MLAEFAQTTPQVLCDTEVEIMETLRWNINMVPTAAMFLSYYVCQYIIRTPKSLHKSILYTTEHVIESDDRFVKALAHLDWAMAIPLAVAGVLPSLLAAWAFWKGLKELEQFQGKFLLCYRLFFDFNWRRINFQEVYRIFFGGGGRPSSISF